MNHTNSVIERTPPRMKLGRSKEGLWSNKVVAIRLGNGDILFWEEEVSPITRPLMYIPQQHHTHTHTCIDSASLLQHMLMQEWDNNFLFDQ